MGTRTVAGNLAADPKGVEAGSITITEFTVLENTGEYRKGEFVKHDTPTAHNVKAKFELGAAALESLTKGASVVVTGREHTESWGDEGERQYKRVLIADTIAAALTPTQRVTIERAERSS